MPINPPRFVNGRLIPATLNGEPPPLNSTSNYPGISLANSAAVNAAYQRLMASSAQGDVDKEDLRRRLVTNLETSQKNRFRSLLNNRQSASDRGFLNSGVALNRMEELNTGFDTTDSQMRGNVDKSIGDIDRNILNLDQLYKDAQVQGSLQTTQDQTDAAAAALLAEAEAEQTRKDREELMAILTGQVQTLAPLEAGIPEEVPLAQVAAVRRKKKAVTPKPVPKPKPVIKQQLRPTRGAY